MASQGSQTFRVISIRQLQAGQQVLDDAGEALDFLFFKDDDQTEILGCEHGLLEEDYLGYIEGFQLVT